MPRKLNMNCCRECQESEWCQALIWLAFLLFIMLAVFVVPIVLHFTGANLIDEVKTADIDATSENERRHVKNKVHITEH